MSDHLRAVKPVRYPVGESLELVREAGGLSKLTDEQRAGLEMRDVAPGETCEDLPEESREWLLEQGLVEADEPISDMTAEELIGIVSDADAGELDRIEEHENSRSKPRVTVLRAIAARREEAADE